MASSHSDRVAAAVAIAARVHAGQTDKGGAPYILHPLHVMHEVEQGSRGIENEHDRIALLCAAVLHDAVEDSDTPGAVRQEIYDACGDRAYSAVDRLTRVDTDSYEDYIERIAYDWIARRVKLADLAHNMDRSRLPAGTSNAMGKYALAYERLRPLGGDA